MKLNRIDDILIGECWKWWKDTTATTRQTQKKNVDSFWTKNAWNEFARNSSEIWQQNPKQLSEPNRSKRVMCDFCDWCASRGECVVDGAMVLFPPVRTVCASRIGPCQSVKDSPQRMWSVQTPRIQNNERKTTFGVKWPSPLRFMPISALSAHSIRIEFALIFNRWPLSKYKKKYTRIRYFSMFFFRLDQRSHTHTHAYTHKHTHTLTHTPNANKNPRCRSMDNWCR